MPNRMPVPGEIVWVKGTVGSCGSIAALGLSGAPGLQISIKDMKCGGGVMGFSMTAEKVEDFQIILHEELRPVRHAPTALPKNNLPEGARAATDEEIRRVQRQNPYHDVTNVFVNSAGLLCILREKLRPVRQPPTALPKNGLPEGARAATDEEIRRVQRQHPYHNVTDVFVNGAGCLCYSLETRYAQGLLSDTGKIYAYTAVVVGNGFLVGRSDLGVEGYTPIPMEGRFRTYGEASKRADEMNAERGLDVTNATHIIATTLPRRPNLKDASDNDLIAEVQKRNLVVPECDARGGA